ncbi:putative acetolactate synthase large subunit [uncultured delta proteobacterium]|uniref:Putative acetolactate synthase large subunit n=1 Tax=uncultured delta proteobacterium TaxID=34034 RepID=A0A212IYT1_9DELT|nr:putative acetolactate synthase large subunit [uncultured delta proteobacterium]
MAYPKKLWQGSEFLAATFAGYGVTHVFYIESVLRQTLIELERRNIRRIMTHSEKAAAYMADGYARASRRAGVCMAQSVGAANLASGMQEAYLAKSPVIAITGKKPSMYRYRHAYQEVDHWPLFEPVSKFNTSIEHASELPQAIRQLFREAVTGTPGPVHIDMPNHQAGIIERGDIASDLIIEKSFSRIPPFRPIPDPAAVKAAVDLIYKAERPLLVAGGGAVMSDAGAEITKLAERLNIPLATSVDGKGIMLENHPLSLGIMGGYGRACTNAIAAEADLVVFIGCSACDQTTKNWTLPSQETPVIQIDINPAELGRNYPNAVSVLGDAKAAAAAMAATLQAPHPNAAWTRKAAQALAEWRKSLIPARADSGSPIKVERLCQIIQDELPEDGILVSDTGFAAIWTASHIDLTKPRQRYIRAAGGSLGWAYPASLGVKCGAPDQPVVCFTGDGGFWYHVAEIETAVRYGIPTVTVVNNNRGLGMCRKQIHEMYGNAEGNRDEMYQFRAASFAQLAETMGAVGITVIEEKDLAPALGDAIRGGKPAVVEVITDITGDPQLY